MAHQPKLLDGVAVLEIGNGIAAPLCGRMMADLGAEVVKLEIPPAGDCTRQWMFPPPKNGVSPAWATPVSTRLRSSPALSIRSLMSDSTEARYFLVSATVGREIRPRRSRRCIVPAAL